MIVFPNAKINLGLHILNKREDGYHNIESLFYPIPLADSMEVFLSETTSLTLYNSSEDIPPEKNLVIKAYELLRQEHPLPPIEIHLDKTIPSGAGMGGGSSDAAFMIRVMNRLANLNLSDEKLAQLAVKIGADCPFFIYNRATIASGIGDIFTPTEISLKGWYLYLIKPPLTISTAEAYSRVTPSENRPAIDQLICTPITSWTDSLSNDFEKSLFPSYPILPRLKAFLYEHGAVYASMSGSGSTIYGLFDREIDLSDHYCDCFHFGSFL